MTYTFKASDLRNLKLGFGVPIYGILTDASTFRFFEFRGDTYPYSFKIGTLGTQIVFSTYDFSFSAFTREPYINSLRPVVEIIFDLLLVCIQFYCTKSRIMLYILRGSCVVLRA